MRTAITRLKPQLESSVIKSDYTTQIGPNHIERMDYVRGDMIEVFKLLAGVENIDLTQPILYVST